MIALMPRIVTGDRRLLPEGRFAGPMPWVIAIMMFLTVLATAAGLGLNQAASHLRQGLADRITIQIVEANPRLREQQVKAATVELSRLAGIRTHRRVPESELKTLLEPWLGANFSDSGLPVPAMIDVDLIPGMQNRVDSIGEAIRAVAPAARIDQHAQWLAPLDQLISMLKWLAFALVLLMAAATAFTVVLAARATLDTHQETISVMHLLGATDSQIAGLFQRRIAIDSMLGGMVGFSGAALMVLLLGQRIASLGSELIGSVSLSPAAWLILLLLPLAGTALAMATARVTILRALGRFL